MNTSARNELIRLSPTALLSYQGCSMQYYYLKRLKVRPRSESWALAFGGAFHSAIESYFKSSVDPVRMFESLFTQANQERVIKYPATWDFDDALATGKRLAEQFPDFWARSGWELLKLDGELMIETARTIDIGDNVHVRCKLDLLAHRPRDGAIAPLDLKTPAQIDATGVYERIAPQLRTQQLVADNLLQPHGMRVTHTGFIKAVKRKVGTTRRAKGPTLEPIDPVKRYSQASINDLLKDYRAVARDIRLGRFMREPGGEYNSPCLMCDAQRLCHNGDQSEYDIPDTASSGVAKAASGTPF